MLTTTNLVGFASGGVLAAPLSHVGLVGSPVSNSGGGTSLVIAVPTLIPAGEHLVVCGGNKTTPDTFTASDSRGNTYIRRAQHNDGSRSCAILTTTLTTALQAADSITLTYPASGQCRTMLVYRLTGTLVGTYGSGVDSGSTLDPNMSVVSAQGFMCYVMQENGSAEVGTPPSGWTEDYDIGSINGAAQIGHKDVFVDPAATTVVNPTTSGTSPWVGVALSVF